jgi:hypothetical protein
MRPEATGLSSLLGFYGITPHVKISTIDFSKPILRLTLLFLTDEVRTSGNYEFSVTILDSQKKMIPTSIPKSRLSLKPEREKRLQLAITMDAIRFSGPGLYEVHISVDGMPIYKTEFWVVQESQGAFGDSSSGILYTEQAEGESRAVTGKEGR